MLLFIDVENLYKSVGKRFSRRLDYGKYVAFLEQKFKTPISVKMAYGSQKPNDAKDFVNFLKALGFIIRFDEGIDWNVSIALSAINLAEQGTTVILGSNSRSLAPLVTTLQDKGVKTFVCGCNIHPQLRDLSAYHEIDSSLLLEV